jgi:hypothetical protein
VNEADMPESLPTTHQYDIPYPASAYTFPREALLHVVRFDNK